MKSRLATAGLIIAMAQASCTRSCSDGTPSESASPSAAPSPTSPLLATAGAQPQARLSFHFPEQRRETAHLVVDSRFERHGTVLVDDHLNLWFEVHYPASNQFVLTLTRAQASSKSIVNIESSVGTRFTQQASANGGIDPPQVSPPKTADPSALTAVRDALLLVAMNFVVFVPEQPIGKGASWTHGPLHYTLADRRDEVFVIERHDEHASQQQTQQGAVTVRETQNHRIEMVVNGIARRIESELRAKGLQAGIRTTRAAFTISKKR